MVNLNMYRASLELHIDPGSRQLRMYIGGELSKTYPVAVGKPATPTPSGDYKIVNKVMNPGGVLGTRWMGLNVPGGNYGIHGTNNPSSIGNRVSLGCIRMQNYSVEELFPQVPLGTPVRVLSVPGYNTTGTSSPTNPGSGPPLDHRVHIVVPGDTLWKIANKYTISLDTLLAANNLTNPDVLEIGQSIYIPS